MHPTNGQALTISTLHSICDFDYTDFYIINTDQKTHTYTIQLKGTYRRASSGDNRICGFGQSSSHITVECSCREHAL